MFRKTLKNHKKHLWKSSNSAQQITRAVRTNSLRHRIELPLIWAKHFFPKCSHWKRFLRNKGFKNFALVAIKGREKQVNQASFEQKSVDLCLVSFFSSRSRVDAPKHSGMIPPVF